MNSQTVTTTVIEEVVNLTPEMLAKRWHIKHIGTLANWRCKGKGPKFIPGRPVKYPLEEVEKYEREHMVASTEDVKSSKIISSNRRSRKR